jgi:hypothetical protein
LGFFDDQTCINGFNYTYSYNSTYNYTYSSYNPNQEIIDRIVEYIDNNPGAPVDLLNGVINYIESESGDMYMGGMERLRKLAELYAPDSQTCPTQRSRSVAGTMSLIKQYLQQLKQYLRNSEAFSPDSPDDSVCHHRRLQMLLRMGAGKLLNNDIKRFKSDFPMDNVNHQEYCLLYANTLREVMNVTNAPNDVDELHRMVNERMNETRDRAIAACDADSKTAYVEAMSLPVYWAEKDNVIYQGIHNPLAEDDGIVWRPMMMCQCEDCLDYSYYNYYSSYSTGYMKKK